MTYGGKGGGIAATIVGGTITAVVLPNTGGTGSIVGVAISVFAGLVGWGLTYGYFNR